MEQRRIKIVAGDSDVTALLGETDTADKVWAALPIEALGSTWGDEVYFETPVQADEEPDATDVVDMGDVGYWPRGRALCLFFGPTPASRGDEIRAASPVNVFGKIEGEAAVLKRVRSGERVVVSKA